MQNEAVNDIRLAAVEMISHHHRQWITRLASGTVINEDQNRLVNVSANRIKNYAYYAQNAHMLFCPLSFAACSLREILYGKEIKIMIRQQHWHERAICIQPEMCTGK